MWRIKYVFLKMKQAFQRAFRGYDDLAVWNFDTWFLRTGSKILDKLAESIHGVPYEIVQDVEKDVTIGLVREEDRDAVEFQRWKDTIKQISLYLKEANEDTCSKQVNYTKDMSDEQLVRISTEVSNYRNDCKNKALDMLKEWLFNLWD